MHLEGVMLSTSSVERAPGKTCNVSRWGGSGFETQQSNSKKQWRWQRQRRWKWQRQRSGGGGSSAVAVIARRQWCGSGGGARRQRVSAAEVAVVVVAQRSGTFERHRRDNVRTFILGQGWRDNGAVDVIIIGSN